MAVDSELHRLSSTVGINQGRLWATWSTVARLDQRDSENQRSATHETRTK